jgi:hypothetical protein
MDYHEVFSGGARPFALAGTGQFLGARGTGDPECVVVIAPSAVNPRRPATVTALTNLDTDQLMADTGI